MKKNYHKLRVLCASLLPWFLNLEINALTCEGPSTKSNVAISAGFATGALPYVSPSVCSAEEGACQNPSFLCPSSSCCLPKTFHNISTTTNTLCGCVASRNTCQPVKSLQLALATCSDEDGRKLSSNFELADLRRGESCKENIATINYDAKDDELGILISFESRGCKQTVTRAYYEGYGGECGSAYRNGGNGFDKKENQADNAESDDPIKKKGCRNGDYGFHHKGKYGGGYRKRNNRNAFKDMIKILKLRGDLKMKDELFHKLEGIIASLDAMKPHQNTNIEEGPGYCPQGATSTITTVKKTSR